MSYHTLELPHRSYLCWLLYDDTCTTATRCTTHATSLTTASLHSNHKHRRFNGDFLDLTMVVPQLDYEIARSDLIYPKIHLQKRNSAYKI